MYSDFSRSDIDALMNQNITYNYHKYAVHYNDFINIMNTDYQLNSVSWTPTNVVFVTSFEHRKYPIYATMYHPEKPIYNKFPNP